MVSGLPLISCIMPTTPSRRDFAVIARDCFERQTYPHKELVVVEEAGYIGLKRNWACERSHGEFIAFWDDDDYSAPGRLAHQLETLQRTGKAVTAYRQIPFRHGSDWFMPPRDATPQLSGTGIGTSLFFRRSWWEGHKFSHTSLGEDALFSRAALMANELVLSDGRRYMYAVRHDNNTWQVDMRRSGWTQLPDFQWKD